MHRKKILHITSTINGGVGRVIEDLLVGCADEYETSLLVLGNIDRLDHDRLNSFNVKIENWNIKNPKNVFLIFRLFRYIRKSNIDIIHTHLFPSLYYVALISLFIKETKLIFTEHSSESNRRKWWMRLIERFIYSRFDKIVAVSTSVCDKLKSWLRADSIVVVSNGFDMNKKLPSCDEFEDNNLENKIVITMASRFVKGKDFETLIDAIGQLNDNYHLLLVGDGELFNSVKDYVVKSCLSSKVDLLGYRDDILKIFKNSDLVVLSTAFEGLPVVLLESISVGTPVVGSDVPGVKDVLGGTNLMFEYGNVNGLVKKIMYVLEEEQSDKIQKTIDVLQEDFDIKHTISEYKYIYRSI